MKNLVERDESQNYNPGVTDDEHDVVVRLNVPKF